MLPRYMSDVSGDRYSNVLGDGYTNHLELIVTSCQYYLNTILCTIHRHISNNNFNNKEIRLLGYSLVDVGIHGKLFLSLLFFFSFHH